MKDNLICKHCGLLKSTIDACGTSCTMKRQHHFTDVGKQDWIDEFNFFWNMPPAGYIHENNENYILLIRSFIEDACKEERKEILTKAIAIFEKNKDEPMTGRVVLLELKALRGDYD